MHLTINIDDVLNSAILFILLLILFNFLLLLPETMKQLRLIAAGERADASQEAEDIAYSKPPDIASDNKTMRVATRNDGNFVPTLAVCPAPLITITDADGSRISVPVFPAPVPEDQLVPVWELFPPTEPEPEPEPEPELEPPSFTCHYVAKVFTSLKSHLGYTGRLRCPTLRELIFTREAEAAADEARTRKRKRSDNETSS